MADPEGATENLPRSIYGDSFDEPSEADGAIRVLVVDDEPAPRDTMARWLTAAAYAAETASGFSEALQKLRDGTFQVVVSDIVMPDGTGLDLLDRLRADGRPVGLVLVTGHIETGVLLDALRRGAGDLLLKPVTREALCAAVGLAESRRRMEVESLRYRQRVENLLVQRTLEVREGESRLALIVAQSADGVVVVAPDGRILFLNPAARRILARGAGDSLPFRVPDPARNEEVHEIRVERPAQPPVLIEVRSASIPWAGRIATLLSIHDVTDVREAAIRRQELLFQALNGTVETMAAMVEMRDPYTAGHQRRVAQLACAIYDEMGLPANGRDGIRIAGMLHDVGKMQTPTEILVKPARLSDLEYRLIQRHCAAGYEILKNIGFPWRVADMVLQHHERMDGSGYPGGLEGDAILPEARILGVSDVVEAMASHRPYRAALGIPAALAEIEARRGVLYDPDVVEACVAVFRRHGFGFE